MIRCQQCKDKDVELLTWWERTKNKLFYKLNEIFFNDDFEDLKSQRYTQGFSDGVISGSNSERKQMEIERLRYEITPKPLTESEIDARLSSLLTNVDFNKVVSVDKAKGFVYIGAEKADPARLNNLKSEAEFLVNTDLWGILHDTPKELAQREMFIHGVGEESLKKGRAVLFTLSQQKNIIDVLRNVVVK